MSRRTWIWIIVGGLALTTVGCFAIVGTTVFMVMRQVKVQETDKVAAGQQFEQVLQRFSDQAPIFTRGERTDEGVARLRKLATEYTGPAPQHLQVLAWDEDEKRVVRVSVPFWLLRLGRSGSLHVGDVDVERLQLDAEELEAAGPVLLLNEVRPDGRVLLWTE